MDSTASSFTLRKNAKRAAEAMIRKGTAPAIDYGIKPSANERFEIVWKTAKAPPATDEVEIQPAEASAGQPGAGSPTEVASQPAPAATEPATSHAVPQPASEAEAASPARARVAAEPAAALSEPARKNEWSAGTRVMVRKRKSWREATIISRLDPDHWRAEYSGGGSGMFREADIRAYDPKRDATPVKQPRRAKATAQRSSRSRYAIDPETIAAGRLPQSAPVVTSAANPHYQKHFDQLLDLAKAGDWDGVRNYKVTGSNSYSKVVARYRQDLLALHAASEAAR